MLQNEAANRVDQGIIRAAKEGSREARGCLLRELQDPWFRMCLALLRDRELAVEAVQESAVRLLRDLPRFREESAFRTWAVGIAVNVVREMKRGRRAAGGDGTGAEACGESAEWGAVREEERAAVREAVGELSERQREAVVLRYFEGMSVEETAAAMKCSPGTVKATVWQALRAMKARLGRVGML